MRDYFRRWGWLAIPIAFIALIIWLYTVDIQNQRAAQEQYEQNIAECVERTDDIEWCFDVLR